MGDLPRLRAHLRTFDRVLVAFSGGADSAFLAWVAHDTLGPERAAAVTAVSPSLAGDEHADCASFTSRWGMTWIEIHTEEMRNAAYQRNDADRCFWCKDALMDSVGPLVAAGGTHDGATVLLGVNVDDLGDHRPGQVAAVQRGAVFPLVDAGFTKADVRRCSRELGLATWDKPAAACLASRVPYGSLVTVSVLSRVERAEAALHRLGLLALRVRHYDDTARIEVPLPDLERVILRRDDVVAAVKGAGYRYVTLDLEGLRSGNLNDALAQSEPRR